MKKGIIFSDLDGTLIFHDDIHKMKKVRNKTDETIVVKDLESNKNYECYNVPTNLYNVFFSVETRDILFELKKDYYIVVVSGARKSSVTNRKHVLDFADAFLIENGGLILDSKFREDKNWSRNFIESKKVLWNFAKKLEDDGWILDFKGRTAAFRIREHENSHKNKSNFKNLEKIKLPKELEKTSNLGSMDIILKKAGKRNAVKYFLNKIGMNKKDSIGIGDDVNDIEMLSETNKKFVIGNAYPTMKKHAKKNKWFISKNKNFEGIKEILLEIKKL